MIDELHALLMGADESKITGSTEAESGNENKAGLSAKVPGTGMGAELTATMTEKTSSGLRSEYTSRKIEALHRNIMRYQALFARLSKLASGPSFLLLDDLYHLRTTRPTSSTIFTGNRHDTSPVAMVCPWAPTYRYEIRR